MAKDLRFWVLRGSDRFYGDSGCGVGVLPCWYRDPLDKLVRRFGNDTEARSFALSRGFAATPHLVEVAER